MPRLARFYDPLASICFYLGIARARLSGLCLEVFGITILEFLDRVRVEGFRAELKESLRGRVAEWVDYLEGEGKRFDTANWNFIATQFLKWMRANGLGKSRQHWAWSLGLPTRARMAKAVFLVEGTTIEAMELEIICELLKREAYAEPEPITRENSVMMGILGDETDAPGAEKAELPSSPPPSISGDSVEKKEEGDSEVA